MSFGFTPRRQAILWGATGIVMMLFTLWRPWFLLDLGGVPVPLGLLFLIYAGLQLTLHVMSRGRVLLSDEEVDRWGSRLERATPLILEELQRGASMKLVAQRAQREYGVPPDITNRYTVALLRSLKREHRDLLIARSQKGVKTE